MNTFEKTIKAYLDNVAQSDAVFAQKYDEGKIEGCCSYIISEVRKSGRQGFADEEIYGMAIHFFDEEPTERERLELENDEFSWGHNVRNYMED